ncbi:MAG TPA: TlpA family protein disulfide reductase [Sediminispirochaeta sp.]|nr:TlpA family protein disulfide reductase [Sediminispirochaeta sp.]
MKKLNKSFTVTAFLVSLLLFSLSGASAQQDVELTPLQEELYNMGFGVFTEEVEAPDFTVPDLEGSQVSLSNQKGKLVLLNLWATWCPPCREEMPSMQELYDRLEPRGFTILAISAPQPPRETEEKIRGYIGENGFNFPVLIDSEFQAFPIYNTGSIPTSYLIDPEGNLVARLTGSIDWTSPGIVDILEKMLPRS